MIQNANMGTRPVIKAPFLNSKKASISIETPLLFCYLSSALDAMFSWGLVQKYEEKYPLRLTLSSLFFKNHSKFCQDNLTRLFDLENSALNVVFP